MKSLIKMGRYIFKKPQNYVDKVDNEIWKDIPGWEGFYQISNLGRIQNKHGKLLATQVKPNGYLKVVIYHQGQQKTLHVHRLVAIAFIDNPYKRHEVNHVNGLKSDNRVANLEWSTRSENNLHAYRVLGRLVKMDDAIKKVKISIEATEIKTGRVLRFESFKKASLYIGVSASCVADAANGIQRQTKGFLIKKIV